MAVTFTDNFTGTVNTPLNTRTASGGGAWQCFGATATDIAGLKINAANQAKVATTTGCLARAETGVTDHYVKAAIWNLTTAVAAVVVRATDNLNFIGFRIYNSTTVELFKRIAGTETSLIRVTVPTLVAPVTLQLMFVGTTATLFVNGARVGLAAGYQVPDPGFLGVTKVGLWGKASALDPLADDFEGGTALTGLVIGSARSGLTDRNVGLAAAAPGAIVLARSRSGLTDRGSTLGIAFALGPNSARLGQTGRATALGEAFALGPARGRSASADRGMTLSLGLQIASGRGRSGLTDRGIALSWSGALTPAKGALAQRAQPVGSTIAVPVAPARAVLSQRATAATIVSFGQIAPNGSRLTERSGSAAAIPFEAGTAIGVPAELRIVSVRHD